jgi:hypothetical protein
MLLRLGAVAAAALALGARLLGPELGSFDDALYELLPYVPAEHFANFGSVMVRTMTCEGRPVVDALRSVGLAQPLLDCGLPANGFPVAVSTVKGGSILLARVMVQVAYRCGLCLGYGYRPSGAWPPPHETVPTYNASALLAIAFVEGWPAYAAAQRGAAPLRCGLVHREPLSRLVSMYLYFSSAGEYALRPVAAQLAALPLPSAVAHMWDSIGRETMLITHSYLVRSLAQGCEPLRFDEFTTAFNATVARVLHAWGVTSDAAVRELIRDPHIQKLDMGRRSHEQLARDHHHSSSKHAPAFKKDVLRELQANVDVMRVIAQQRKDLGYDSAGRVQPKS